MTNPRSILIPIALTLAAACFDINNPTRVGAVPSQMSHEMSGSVRRIDQQTLTIVLTGPSQARDVRVEFEGDKVLPRWFTVHSWLAASGNLCADPLQPPFDRLGSISLPRFLADRRLTKEVKSDR